MTSVVSDHCGGADRADQGKLPLRQHTVRSERGAGQRDALYLLALFEARRVVGVLHAGAGSPDHTDVKHHFCANCGCSTYSESPDWSTGKPDFENPRIAVNSHLLDEFDLDAVAVTVIDGKNLW